jgi:hypothetical protein
VLQTDLATGTAAVRSSGESDLGAICDPELAHDLADMDLYGRLSHAELAPDDLVGVALTQALQNALLSLGQLR